VFVLAQIPMKVLKYFEEIRDLKSSII